MLLHMSNGDIDRTLIHEGAILIERAVEIKEKFEIVVLASAGVHNPSEWEQYGKYFRHEEEETSLEDDLKEAEQIKNVLAMVKDRKNGRR